MQALRRCWAAARRRDLQLDSYRQADHPPLRPADVTVVEIDLKSHAARASESRGLRYGKQMPSGDPPQHYAPSSDTPDAQTPPLRMHSFRKSQHMVSVKAHAKRRF